MSDMQPVIAQKAPYRMDVEAGSSFHRSLDGSENFKEVPGAATRTTSGSAPPIPIGVPCRPRNFPESQLYQLFIKDPDGLTVELNFFGVTKAPDWGGEDYSKMPRVAKKPAKKKAAKALA